jgi:hypothetical protein
MQCSSTAPNAHLNRVPYRPVDNAAEPFVVGAVVAPDDVPADHAAFPTVTINSANDQQQCAIGVAGSCWKTSDGTSLFFVAPQQARRADRLRAKYRW